MSFLLEIGRESLRTLELAAPFLILGLMMAGALHVLLPDRLVQRFLGGRGLGGVLRAALIGVPLPVCSCGVVPLAIAMRRKGASEPASLSFLITTPESSADSILLTWGLMGPWMAIARPIAALFTAVLGGVGALRWLPEASTSTTPEPSTGAAEDGTPSCCCADTDDVQTPVDASETATFDPTKVTSALRRALRYAFVELLDDIAFWLVIGILAAGVIGALVPADLSAWGLGHGIVPMLAVLLVAVPLYMCASASTPVAAMLLAKGLSPGAGLVFLLAGPATNAASVVVLTKTFGRRFVGLYLGSVAVGALLAGLAFDAAVAVWGLKITAPLAHDHHAGFALLARTCAVVLSILVGWRLVRGGWSRGVRELRTSLPGSARA